MKGVIFNLLESFISEGWGIEKYEEILDLCPLQTKQPFVGPGTYPDADLVTIASKAADTLGLPLPVALRAFGKFCFPKLAPKVPQLVETHANARERRRRDPRRGTQADAPGHHAQLHLRGSWRR
jgi:hypothetical protein